MNDLESKVNELGKNKKPICDLLQEIMYLFFEKYVIEIKGKEIKPLWLEAYYYCDIFKDGNVHGSYDKYAQEKQTGRFGQLYVHKNDWGIDVCLSSGDYCLSLLVKCALIEKDGAYVFRSQRQIGEDVCYELCEMKDTCKSIKNCIYNEKNSKYVIKEKQGNPDKNCIFKTARVGLKKDNNYSKYILAAFVFDEKYLKHYRWATGYGKQWTISINSLFAKNGDMDSARISANKLNRAKIGDDYWKSAKDFYEMYYKEAK